MQSEKDRSFLKYEITGGPAFSIVRIFLEQPGQQVRAEGGAMVYMDGHIQMETKSAGGVMRGLKRKFSGESMFQNFFSLPDGVPPGMVAFAHGAPGDIIHLHLEKGEEWVLSQDAYICGTPSIEVTSRWGGAKGLFGGEGLVLTKIMAEAEGDVWIGGYGFVERHDLESNQEFVVDNGVLMAVPADMHDNARISKVGGTKSLVLGGEGIVIRYTGPGVVYTQNREIGLLAALLKPYLPVPRG
ncbi:MAG: TIGR00266 family protein [Candidatus Thorarchaeota archaeon]